MKFLSPMIMVWTLTKMKFVINVMDQENNS